MGERGRRGARRTGCGDRGEYGDAHCTTDLEAGGLQTGGDTGVRAGHVAEGGDRPCDRSGTQSGAEDRQTPEGRHRKLRTYANVSLLCVDEVGYLSFDDKSADLLYEVINRRYERKSLILTTNRPFKEWNQVFPNAACIVTLLDRLLHHADVTVIEGDSYRVRESEQETAARRRKKK